MIDDMGILRIRLGVSSLNDRGQVRYLDDVMVDTGAEYPWVPAEMLRELGVERERMERFETADGRVLERPVGYALLFVGGRSTPSIVVFAEPGDMVLLGAFGLEGLNMKVDLVRRELVPAGPVPAAAAA